MNSTDSTHSTRSAPSTHSTRVFWSLGSNINAQKHISFAVSHFRRDFETARISKLYKCPAVGFVGEDFLNAVIAFHTEQSLGQLLAYADELEKAAGRERVRRGRFDSRTLDVDLLIYGDFQGEYRGRVWPSEDLMESAHVLRPLVDIAGNERHPVSGRLFSSLWEEFDQDAIELTEVAQLW